MNLRKELGKKAAVLTIAFGIGGAILIANRVSAQTPAAQGPGPTEDQSTPAAGRGGRGGRGTTPGRGSAYPTHAQADADTIARGKVLFDSNCAFCHGSDARGGEGGGPNLVRSQLVMNDSTGELIAPVVEQGRPDLGMPKFDLTTAQITDIAGYIHQVTANYRLILAPPPNILVGNATAGEAYFNGAGRCNTCHSVTGDLARIGTKLDPKALQDAIVSGGGGGRGGRGAAATADIPPTTVKVTLPNGKTSEGNLGRMDDFTVELTDANGNHLSFRRDGDVPKVEVKNPLQAHKELLTKYTDDDIHNLTSYLSTIK